MSEENTEEKPKTLGEALKALEEKPKSINEVLDEIISDPTTLDFMGMEGSTKRTKQLALICKFLVEVVDSHQAEIERLTNELVAVKSK
jgi:F0F1-type ATP synthase delta subunit